MVVYVENVIIDNMFFDCFLLYCTAKTLHINVSKLRLLLGGVVGTLCAFSSALPFGVAVVIKIVSLPLMCIIAVGRKKTFWYALVFCAYTFLLGGVILGLFFALNVNFTLVNGAFNYNLDLPVSFYVVAIVAFGALVYSVLFLFKRIKHSANCFCKVTVHLPAKVSLSGYFDTGNVLCQDGVPVCFVSTKIKPFVDYFAKCVLSGNTNEVNCATVTGESKVIAVPSVVTVGKVSHNVLLACGKFDDFDVLLNNNLEVNDVNESVSKTAE